MNMEIVSSLKVVKYLFKYLFKGFDRALVEAVQNVDDDGISSHGLTGNMTVLGHILIPQNMKLPPGIVQVH